MHAIKSSLLAATLLVLACACGTPGSGVEGATLLSDTTAEDRVLLCDYWDSVFMGEYRSAESCPMLSIPVMVGGARDVCEAALERVDATCTATVATFERCLAAGEPDACEYRDESVCPQALWDCF